MSIFDKIMKKEQQVEKMSCNCQQLAEEWLMKHNTDKENTEIIKSAENKKRGCRVSEK